MKGSSEEITEAKVPGFPLHVTALGVFQSKLRIVYVELLGELELKLNLTTWIGCLNLYIFSSSESRLIILMFNHGRP